MCSIFHLRLIVVFGFSYNWVDGGGCLNICIFGFWRLVDLLAVFGVGMCGLDVKLGLFAFWVKCCNVDDLGLGSGFRALIVLVGVLFNLVLGIFWLN